jgi:hypothetical protein
MWERLPAAMAARIINLHRYRYKCCDFNKFIALEHWVLEIVSNFEIRTSNLWISGKGDTK